MLKAEKREFLKTGRAKPAVGNLVLKKQVVHGGRVSSSVGNCRTRRAVHKGRPLWSGRLSTRASCKPRFGAAVRLFGSVECQGGAFTVKTQFSKVKAELQPARRVSGSPAVSLANQGGAFAVKTQFSKVKAELYPVRKGGGCWALCPCPRCQGVQGITAIKPACPALWVQSRTVEAAASLKGNAMKAKLLRLAALSAPLLAAQAARAADPATALEAVQTLTTSSAGFGPVMFGLAIASVGIGIGVKWIKRSKGAA